MNVIYNEQGIGDVLIIPLKEERDSYNINHEQFGPIVKIMDHQGEILGYNIFQASTHFNFTETGRFMLTEELLKEINELFVANELSDPLDVDLSPKFVVGYVKSKSPHENADKLSVCQVDVGEEQLQIVCGAANVDEGQKVVVAKVGATMPGGLEIKDAELRGVSSSGMICSREELGLPKDPEENGIYVLEESSAVGEPFIF